MLLYLSVFSHGTLVEGFVRRDRIAFLKLDRVEAEAVVRAKEVRIVSGSPFVTRPEQEDQEGDGDEPSPPALLLDFKR